MDRTISSRPRSILATSPVGRWRVRLIDALNAGPGPILLALSVAIGPVSAFALALGLAGSYDGTTLGAELALVVLGAAGILAASITGAWCLRGLSGTVGQVRLPSHGRSNARVFLLALTLWSPFLVFPIFFLAAAAKPSTETWLAYGFADKRWMTSLYFLGTLGAMLAITAGAAVARGAAARSDSWRAWATFAVHPAAPRRPGDERALPALAIHLGAKVIVGILFAAYFFSPPWHAGTSGGSIDGHIDANLGPIQAVDHGAVPYIGAASTQYGPGSQLIAILYMGHIHLSIVGLREAFALYHWLGATIFLTALCLRFPLRIALPAGAVAILVFPTLQIFSFIRGTGYVGFWGWGNVLRYVGGFTLGLFLSSVIIRSTTKRRLIAGFVLGWFWGILCYVSQENLAAGVIAGGTLSALFLLTQTYPARAIGQALGAILTGFSVSWLPALIYYAYVGDLGRFLQLYAFMPTAVARGYSNSSYPGWSDPWAKTYFTLPFVLATIGLSSILQFRPFGVALRWTRERVALVSVAVAAITSHEGALLRADSSHLMNTMLAVPVLLVVLVAYGSRVYGIERGFFSLVFAAAIVAVALGLLPSHTYRPRVLLDRIVAPVTTRLDGEFWTTPPDAPRGSVAAARVGASLLGQPSSRPVSMPRFVAIMDRLHDVIGNRATYVASFKDAYPGLVYFVADLRPAPILLEPSTLIVNLGVQGQFLRDFRDHINNVRAIVTLSLESPEAKIFAHTFPAHRTITLQYLRDPVFVLLRPSRPRRKAPSPSAYGFRLVVNREDKGLSIIWEASASEEIRSNLVNPGAR
jgi:hypothetical protein